MPDQGLVPPMDASQLPDYLDASRKQMLAQMLMQNTQRSLQTPQDWNSMRVVPKRSMLSNLASLGSAYAAGKFYPQALEAQAKYTTGLFNDPTPQAPPSAPPEAPNIPPESIRAPGYTPPQIPPTNTAPSGPSLQNSMVPPGMSKQMAARLWMTLGPQGYAEKVMLPSQMGTPEWQTLMKATGGNSDKAAQLIMMKASKEGYIAPIGGTRPGTIAFDPRTYQPLFGQPDVSHNVQLTPDGMGGATAAPIPGNTAAQAQLAGAETGAKEANTFGTLPTAGGGSRVGWLGSLLGPPPSQAAPTMGLPPGARPQPPPAPAAAQAAPETAPATPKPYFQGAQVSPKNDPFPDAPRVATSTSLGAPDATTAVIQKARGEKQVELQTKYGDEADLANQQIERIQAALDHVKGANFGPWSDEITNMQGILHEIAPSLFSGGAATNTQIFKKNAVNLALQGAKGIYGPKMTSSEVMLQKNEASPSEQQTREAATSLLKQQQILAEYNRQRSKDYDEYVAAGHDPLRFASWYANVHNPVQKYALQHDTERQVQLAKDRGLNIPQEAFERLRDKPELKPFFQKKYGYIPDGF